MNINGCNQLKDVYTRFLTLPPIWAFLIYLYRDYDIINQEEVNL